MQSMNEASAPAQQHVMNHPSTETLLGILEDLVIATQAHGRPGDEALIKAQDALRAAGRLQSPVKVAPADPLRGVPPHLAQAIGQLSMAMNSPAVHGRDGDLFTPLVNLAAQRIKQADEHAKHIAATSSDLRALSKSLNEAVAVRVHRTDNTCRLELDFRCHGMAKLAEGQLKTLSGAQ